LLREREYISLQYIYCFYYELLSREALNAKGR